MLELMVLDVMMLDLVFRVLGLDGWCHAGYPLVFPALDGVDVLVHIPGCSP